MLRRVIDRRNRLFSAPDLSVADATEGVRLWRRDAQLVSG